jgi:hypothetical protein
MDFGIKIFLHVGGDTVAELVQVIFCDVAGYDLGDWSVPVEEAPKARGEKALPERCKPHYQHWRAE